MREHVHFPMCARKVLMDKLVKAAAIGEKGHVLNVTSAAAFSAWKGAGRPGWA